MGPVAHSDGCDGFGLGGQVSPCVAGSVDNGVVIFEDKAGRSWFYTSAKPYREANDPLSENYSDLADRLRATYEAHQRGEGEGDDAPDTP